MPNDIIFIQDEPRGPSILVEIPVTTSGQKVKLPDVQQLRSQPTQTIIIKSVRLITTKILSGGILQGLPNAPLVELQNMSLTLYSEQWLKGENIPILTFNDFVDSDSANATTIPYRNKTTRLNNWRNVDWAQSYLLFANGFTPTPSYVVLLDVEYLKLNVKGEIIDTAS